MQTCAPVCLNNTEHHDIQDAGFSSSIKFVKIHAHLMHNYIKPLWYDDIQYNRVTWFNSLRALMRMRGITASAWFFRVRACRFVCVFILGVGPQTKPRFVLRVL